MGEEEDQESSGHSLEHTPTWAVAITCTAFVLVSIFLERFNHTLTKRWKGKLDKEYKRRVLEKIKEELMVLGFISLLLTGLQTVVSKICIPVKWTYYMLPCERKQISHESSAVGKPSNSHKLLQFMESPRKRILEEGVSEHCHHKGKAPFLSNENIHQLHIFIFVLTVVHIFISFMMMALGRYKIYRWEIWEAELTRADQEAAKQDGILKFTMEDEFLQKHAHHFWSEKPILRWMVCFFRQFFSSVIKEDYIYMRCGFINTHLNGNNSYDFHKYIIRSLEDDFKKVVGVSSPLWIYVVLFMLINIHGWHTYFWVSFVPLILMLIVGAKLQMVINEMAIEAANKRSVVQGEIIIQPRDELFWFHKPKLLLSLMHFILFQNAFEFSFFFWVWTSFGFNSCFFETLPYICIRLAFGSFIQIFISYVTLPLYALVSQMGSNYKAVMMTEAVSTAAKEWLERAKRKQAAKKLRKSMKNKAVEHPSSSFTVTCGGNKDIEMAEIEGEVDMEVDGANEEFKEGEPDTRRS